MPVPSSIASLSTTASANPPAGNTPALPEMDDHIRQAYAFIRSVSDSVGGKLDASAVSAFMLTVLNDADAAAARATLGALGLVVATPSAGTDAANKAYVDTAISGVASALSFSALSLSATGAGAGVSITAGEVLLRSAGGVPKLASAVSLTVDTSTVGANGLDTGTLAASTWYAVWVISNGSTTAGLVSLSSTAPTMPSGYTFKARVGWIRTDGTANKWPLGFTQRGRMARYLVGSGNVSAAPVIISGTQGNSLTPVYVASSVASVAPPTVAAVCVTLIVSGTLTASVAPNGNYGNFGSLTNPPPMGIGANNSTVSQSADILLEGAYPQNIYYTAGAASAALFCAGWQDNL